MTETEFRALYERLRRQVPWGPDDRRGALNYITQAEVLAALAEPRLGRTVSLAAPVENWPAADNPDPAQHEMKGPLGADAGPGLSFSMDRIAMNIHGNADSHVDALCHVIFDRTLYNGLSAGTVTENGAAELSIGVAADGIVGRGVLLDVPRSRGVPWLEPGDHVTAEDMLAAERDQGVRIGRGDIVFVRVGHRRRRTEQGPWDSAASRPACIRPCCRYWRSVRSPPWAVTATTTPPPAPPRASISLCTCWPSTRSACTCWTTCSSPGWPRRVQTAGRWSFLCVIAPLRLPTGTGSPVNPIAIL